MSISDNTVTQVYSTTANTRPEIYNSVFFQIFSLVITMRSLLRTTQFWQGSIRHLSTSNHVSQSFIKKIMTQYFHIRTISCSNLATPVYTYALKHGPRLAITDDTTSYTYSSLYNHSTRMAKVLGWGRGRGRGWHS